MINRIFEICGEREMTEEYKHFDFLKETEFKINHKNKTFFIREFIDFNEGEPDWKVYITDKNMNEEMIKCDVIDISSEEYDYITDKQPVKTLNDLFK